MVIFILLVLYLFPFPFSKRENSWESLTKYKERGKQRVFLKISKCYALRDLVPFIQTEKHPWRSAEASNFTKSSTPPWVFSRFLNCINDTESRKASEIWTGEEVI